MRQPAKVDSVAVLNMSMATSTLKDSECMHLERQSTAQPGPGFFILNVCHLI